MGPYLGDFAENSVIDFMWDTNDAGGASITRATDGTVSVYKANSTTESTTGVTDTEDFDSLTGIHHCRIDTSDAFYAVGNDYAVVLSAATIDGQTVNAVVAHFSIENRYSGAADALNAAIPGSPTADSVNERLKALDDLLQASGPGDAAAVKTEVDTLHNSRLTSVRAGYLDKLSITGNVASSAEVTAIQNNTRVRVIVPPMIERPDSGSTAYKLHLYIYDTEGNMEVPDSTPTIAAENQAGTDRSANLGAVTLEGTGHYSVTYTVASDHAIEQILFEWSVVEGGVTRLHGAAAQIVDTTAVAFTAADRVDLQAVLADTNEMQTDNVPGLFGGLNDVSPADVKSQVDAALDTAIPGSPTADSVNQRLKAIDVLTEASGGGDLAAIKGQTDSLVFVAGDVKATLAGEPVAVASLTAAALAQFAADDTGAVSVGLRSVCILARATRSVAYGPLHVVASSEIRMTDPVELNASALEARTFSFAIVDDGGSPVDLSEVALRFVIFTEVDPPEVAELAIETGDITRTAGQEGISNVVGFTVDLTSKSSAAKRWRWQLWDLDSNVVLAYGPFNVRVGWKTAPA